MQHIHPIKQQQGAALIIALVFLVAITLLGLTSMRSSTMEMRMALNEESRITALEQAQAVVDMVQADDTNTPMTNAVDGELVGCFKSDNFTPPATVNCPSYNLPLNDDHFDGAIYAEVRRLTPAIAPAPRGLGMSGDKFEVGMFGVTGGYDRSDEGLGASEVEQGLIKPLPKTRGINN